MQTGALTLTHNALQIKSVAPQGHVEGCGGATNAVILIGGHDERCGGTRTINGGLNERSSAV